jgi:hypothetical protein
MHKEIFNPINLHYIEKGNKNIDSANKWFTVSYKR